ncbi:Spo0E like sporulation regulatory protein [Anaerobacterium chartisolvens]|uniref:Spo0E like sporulation regulatory protein n=1 Tax=Anaerobacterium chartisolvens TaxID=1297424 RepID=A0A369BHK4_9FIRM|nr:aspartyl-phosphate phosphatase Spo0E family protein [Anaerobacterium chartisolvens]RCX21040.1 Spo0E like sporulation regulatory protein [Anaerobacterium chartisolvens]
MREYAAVNDEIRSLQEEMNLLLGQKGFMEYDRVLSLSQKLDEIINEWIRIKGFARSVKLPGS